jgi:hypothetical protein
MTSDHDLADPAALAAVQLRQRLRALAVGQEKAFDLLRCEFGAGSALGSVIVHGTDRLPYLATLVGDVAWTHGESAAYDGSKPPRAPEADAVERVFRDHGTGTRRVVMNSEQRVAVVAYLDALLVEVASCLELDQHAPSATLGREARRFMGDFSEVRRVAAL